MTRTALASLLVLLAFAGPTPAQGQDDPIGPPPGQTPPEDDEEEPLPLPEGPTQAELQAQADALLAEIEGLAQKGQTEGQADRWVRLRELVTRAGAASLTDEPVATWLKATETRIAAVPGRADIERLVQEAERARMAPERQGRVAFSRQQGDAAGLKSALEGILAALKGSDSAAQSTALRALAPDEAALKDAFTEAGYKAIGKQILEGATRLFQGEPQEIARRLGMTPSHEEVQVFDVTTEDLLSMDAGTVAAREFAAGLRRTAEHLKPRYRWYCAVLRAKGETPTEPLGEGEVAPAGARLQVFLFTGGRWVLLGRIWRVEGE